MYITSRVDQHNSELLADRGNKKEVMIIAASRDRVGSRDRIACCAICVILYPFLCILKNYITTYVELILVAHNSLQRVVIIW